MCLLQMDKMDFSSAGSDNLGAGASPSNIPDSPSASGSSRSKASMHARQRSAARVGRAPGDPGGAIGTAISNCDMEGHRITR